MADATEFLNEAVNPEDVEPLYVPDPSTAKVKFYKGKKYALVPLGTALEPTKQADGATNKIVQVLHASLTTWKNASFFSSTYQLDQEQELVVIGMLVNGKMTQLSPDTDAGVHYSRARFLVRIGVAPTEPSSQITSKPLELKHTNVTGAKTGSMKHAGPFGVRFAEPIVVKKNDESAQAPWYIYSDIEWWRASVAAHTAQSTYKNQYYIEFVVLTKECAALFADGLEAWDALLKNV